MKDVFDEALIRLNNSLSTAGTQKAVALRYAIGEVKWLRAEVAKQDRQAATTVANNMRDAFGCGFNHGLHRTYRDAHDDGEIERLFNCMLNDYPELAKVSEKAKKLKQLEELKAQVAKLEKELADDDA